MDIGKRKSIRIPNSANASLKIWASVGTCVRSGILAFSLGTSIEMPAGVPAKSFSATSGTSQPNPLNALLICLANVHASWSFAIHEIINGNFGLSDRNFLSFSRSTGSRFRGSWCLRTSNRSRSAVAVFSRCSFSAISTFSCSALAYEASLCSPATLPFSVSKSPDSLRFSFCSCITPRAASWIRASASCRIASCTPLPALSSNHVINAISNAVKTSTAMYTANTSLCRLVAASMGFEDWIVIVAIIILAIGSIAIGAFAVRDINRRIDAIRKEYCSLCPQTKRCRTGFVAR